MIYCSLAVVSTGIALKHLFHKSWDEFHKFKVGYNGFTTIPLMILYGLSPFFVLFIGNPLLIKIFKLIPVLVLDPIEIITMILLIGDYIVVISTLLNRKLKNQSMIDISSDLNTLSMNWAQKIYYRVSKRIQSSYKELEYEKEESARFAQGMNFYKLFWLFLIGAFMGDIIETIFCRITMGYWMSRSSLIYGHFSIVWGLGCMLLSMFLYRYRDRSIWMIFVYGTFVGAAYEYLCSVFTETVFQTKFWDYSSIPFNLGGRVNLLYSMFWGIAAVVWLKIAYPFLEKLIERIPKRIGPILTYILLILLVADMAISGLALVRYSKRRLHPTPSNELEAFLDKHYDDERMFEVYPKAKILEEE